VIKAMCLDYQQPGLFETENIFGTGQAAFENYRSSVIVPRQADSARKTQSRDSLQDTQEQISFESAPAIESEY
jgi:hypothetical protein